VSDGGAVPGGSGPGGGTGTGSGSGTGDGIGPASKGIGMSPGPYRAGQGIEPPRKIKDVAPLYPPAALTARAFGTVIVEATVGADGKVHDARVVHSIPSLDQAALDAVRQWEFEPSRLNGTPVAVIVTVLVQFAIH
jgi:protein TonB